MMNQTLMGNADARALHAMQRGPAAYHCPAGHGPLRVWPDTSSPVGLSLVCTACGHRIIADAALVDLATSGDATTELKPEPEPEPEPEPAAPMVRLPDGSAPRGLRPDGTVRTTGWVQLGRLPVSSGFWAALATFAVTIPLIGQTPLIPFVTTPLGYLLWKLCTTTWRPASQAVNTERTPAAELAAGQQIRLYGTAGPVGEVSTVGADAVGRIRLRVVGGLELLLRPGQRVWQVDLQN